jgi:iron(III) transport system ATP-binding protein
VSGLELRGVGVAPLLTGVDLTVADSEVLVLVGPSGAGKTTLLRAVAGRVPVSAGSIRIGTRDVTTEPPERRRVGLVFQDHALFPHLDVAGNVGFGVARRERAARVAELLSLVRLDGFARRRPHELSGGESQRVALARALAPRPEVLLLDEPFASLDPELREALRREVRSILRASGTTAVVVTHDVADAEAVGDRVVTLRAGRLVE